jgi:hypothetical protein
MQYGKAKSVLKLTRPKSVIKQTPKPNLCNHQKENNFMCIESLSFFQDQKM